MLAGEQAMFHENCKSAFLVFVDILGFEKLACSIAKNSNVNESKVRSDFLAVIEDRINAAKKNGYLIGSKNGQGDDWLLAVNSIGSLLKTVFGLLEHNTGLYRI